MVRIYGSNLEDQVGGHRIGIILSHPPLSSINFWNYFKARTSIRYGDLMTNDIHHNSQIYSPLLHFGDYILCWSATKWSVSGMSITPRGPMPGLAMASKIKPLKGDVWSMMSCKGEEILICSSYYLWCLYYRCVEIHSLPKPLCRCVWRILISNLFFFFLSLGIVQNAANRRYLELKSAPGLQNRWLSRVNTIRSRLFHLSHRAAWPGP